MPNNILAVRVQLRYDTFNHWMNNDTVLLPGEIAIAAIPRNTISISDNTPENTPPAIGIKVGDGLHYFDELPWLQGIAADVYNWAKTATKPTYTATEIEGLAEYISTHSSGGGEGGSSSSSAYRIYYDSTASKYILQYYDDTTESWLAASGDEIGLSSIINRINTIERWANGARTQLGNIELPIVSLIYDEVITQLNKINVEDLAEAHEFVTSVQQVDGKIRITRSIIKASDITEGVLSTEHGGIGRNRVENDEVLVGSSNGDVTTRTFVTEIDLTNRDSFVTAGGIIDYVARMTAGLTGAMHFVGEATVVIDTKTNNHVDPQIAGYNFRNALPGDVILANNAQEYVWTGSEWRLLGDEGSYAIKGSITNADIAEEANIAQDKIDGLPATLENKVDKIEGKGLSTNDYSTEEKNKLRDIEDNAQENIIEHIFVNDAEINPTTIGGQNKSVNLEIPILSEEEITKLTNIENKAQVNVIEHVFVNGTEIVPATINENPKSVGINFTPFTEAEKTKLSEIEAEAQVNKIETLTINGTEYIPDNNKNIDITIDQAALNLDVIAGARVPTRTQGTYEEVDITRVNGEKFLELASIAKTGILCENENYWNSSSIVPLNGELIIYSVDNNHDYARLKVGDGVRTVTALPFIDAGTLNGKADFIVKYDNFNSFPQPGSPDKLYVDLATDKIYYYMDAIGYKSLSNFTLDIEKTTVKDIVYWGPGKAATATVNNNILVLENGIAPQLFTQGISVVTGVQITGN